ncbi:helix-turn-helix domain-containing protein [Actinoplanes couchii]|uniref:HTH cro/C1-type domain-containing protein n=1 Tax=Actinoplanes couchii TaxID=403638 RepID=A0ABQ3X7T0_9ACTN|nr:helix-turn-helix transcriptional regulator [Actinoplanes couchii]MDR6320421.1 transcriptional regulator with XRE-family HTH domain [Actinoplanes couchii]GID54567.1 hypothetical protein Aco03nite_029710 [Actinoplanes couchii]
MGVPGAEDEPVGAALARMRRAKRISGTRLAALAGMSQPKISRIERGQGTLNPDDVDAIARALGMGDAEIQALVARAAKSYDRMTDWRPTSAGLALAQETLAEWESGAARVRTFEPTLVPGPLQAHGYAKLVLRAFQRLLVLTEEERSEPALLAAVSARLRRQEHLANPDTAFEFIMGEAALKIRTHPPVEVLAQINHLRDILARHPNVRITIVPDGAPTPIPLQHGFTVIDDALVLVDLYNTGLTSHSRNDVMTYHRVFELLQEQAVGVEPFLDRYQSMYIGMLREG